MRANARLEVENFGGQVALTAMLSSDSDFIEFFRSAYELAQAQSGLDDPRCVPSGTLLPCGAPQVGCGPSFLSAATSALVEGPQGARACQPHGGLPLVGGLEQATRPGSVGGLPSRSLTGAQQRMTVDFREALRDSSRLVGVCPPRMAGFVTWVAGVEAALGGYGGMGGFRDLPYDFAAPYRG